MRSAYWVMATAMGVCGLGGLAEEPEKAEMVGVVTPNRCPLEIEEDHQLKLVGAAYGVLYISQPKFRPKSDEWAKQEAWEVGAQWCTSPGMREACKPMHGVIRITTNTKEELGGTFDLVLEGSTWHWKSTFLAIYRTEEPYGNCE